MIANSNSVSCFFWTGIEQHANSSQTGRAIGCLYALTGSFDAPGGNVIFDTIPTNQTFGREHMPEMQMSKSIGLEERPIGGEAIFNWITSEALYDAVLDKKPYEVKTLVSFGMNMLLTHADTDRGIKALSALDFMVHADLQITPTAQYADILLPINTPWERDGLRTNFHADQRASGHIQYRPQMIESLGESRSDTWVCFELARRLDLNHVFWEGDVDAAWHEILAPSGVDLDELRATPGGITLPLETLYRKHEADEVPARGFRTPTGRIEIFSTLFHQHGYAPLPEYVEPAVGPNGDPERAREFPLVLTMSKSTHYLHSQMRALPRLRRHEREPRLLIHPDTAISRAIDDGEWIEIETPHGKARAVARLNQNLDPRVVCGTHGWWEACDALDASAHDATSDSGANLSRIIGIEAVDPIGGAPPMRSYLCEVRKA